jgi:hypothetical protein
VVFAVLHEEATAAATKYNKGAECLHMPQNIETSGAQGIAIQLGMTAGRQVGEGDEGAAMLDLAAAAVLGFATQSCQQDY